ncbi:MAG: phosphoribosylglycinamide formyltransferase [Deferribacteraceae bacterium]|jgi:phosphoribosylglycinamide formyltransferase-1|nr:phosphoribosylglycinamide formyltransferase [Deferribacteraceae bacterium]
MSNTNIATLLSGRGSNFRAINEAIKHGGIKDASIAVVISDKPNAEGLLYARNNKIEVFTLNPELYDTREDYDEEILRIVQQFNIGLICLAGYMKIVSKVLLNAYSGKIMNVHPSLLPAFPGLHAQKQALNYGVRISGCTVHFVDSGLDAGPIILQGTVPVFSDDNEHTLSERILKEEHLIYPKAVGLYTKGLLSIQGRTVKILQEHSKE